MMPWDIKENKPPDSPWALAGLPRRWPPPRRRGSNRCNWTKTHGRSRLQLRLSDFIVAVVFLWTVVAEPTHAESVTNASSTSMANSTDAAPPTVGPEASPNQTPNRPMESSLNKVFYSSLLFLLVPLVSYLTATVIKILCPISKTPGSFCCPKYQIGDSGEASRDPDVEKAGRDEQRVKNAILLLFTIDVNEEKEEEEELKELEQAMKRLKERRLKKMRNAVRRGVNASFLPPDPEQLTTEEDAAERSSIAEEDKSINADSNPAENADPTHTNPNQEELPETTLGRTGPSANINLDDIATIQENRPLSLDENMPLQNRSSGSTSKTDEPFENPGPSSPVNTNPPDSILVETPTQHGKSISIPNPTENIESMDASSSRENNSPTRAVEKHVKKPTRNFSTISASTVTLIQNHECNESIPARKPAIGDSESKDGVFQDKEPPDEPPTSSPVTDQALQKQKDDTTSPVASLSPAENNRPAVLNHRATANNLAREIIPETKATAETASGGKDTYQVLVSEAANQPKQTVNTGISKTEHVQTNRKLESVNTNVMVGSEDPCLQSSDNTEPHTCSDSDRRTGAPRRISRGRRKGEASVKSEGGGYSTVPLKAILVQPEDIV